MNKVRLMFEVARWEFGRFFKIKDVVVTVLILVALTTLVGGSIWFIQRSATPDIAIINPHILQLESVATTDFKFQFARPEQEPRLREAVGRHDLEGLLIIKSIDNGELITSGTQLWTNQLATLLTNARQRAQVERLQMPPNERANFAAPFAVSVIDQTVGRASNRMEQIYAGVVACLMILAIFACYQYQFTSITGEKHRRVTEQIISAISSQVWMDGKILGISAIGTALMVVYGGTTLLISCLAMWFAGYDPTQVLPLVSTRSTFLILILTLFGILCWNCLFAAIAATVDDPNTSSRTAIMFVAFVPVTITVAAMQNPTSGFMKFLGIFPFTSPTALSARLVMTQVALWEILAAFVLLILTIWLLRKAAAKIFRLAMLMYGKEPSLREMTRWLFES